MKGGPGPVAGAGWRAVPRAPKPSPGASLLWPLLGLLGCSGSGASAQPGASAPPMSPPTYTVSVSQARPATLMEEKLSLRLVGVKDSRCPEGVRCIWAGHAAVTLAVSQKGGPSQEVVIGTEAPDNLNLPFKAGYGPYTLSLVKLEPRPTKDRGVPLPRYVATVQVTRQ